jgi:hypothetical protein
LCFPYPNTAAGCAWQGSRITQLADGIATATLNRPEKSNAIDLSIAQRQFDVAIACDEDASICCVVVKAACLPFKIIDNMSRVRLHIVR